MYNVRKAKNSKDHECFSVQNVGKLICFARILVLCNCTKLGKVSFIANIQIENVFQKIIEYRKLTTFVPAMTGFIKEKKRKNSFLQKNIWRKSVVDEISGLE